MLPVAAGVWLLLWKGTFGVIENGVSLFGLVTLAFVVAAWRLHPPLAQLASGLVPATSHAAATNAHATGRDTVRYWFLAVSILGASISPYLFFFYSAGAIEDHWTEQHLGTNRIVAAAGMSFGTLISAAVLVVAALVLGPRGIKLDDYLQLPLLLSSVMGRWGFFLFAASLAISCFGAALEVSLALAYLVAQGFGWSWGESQSPGRAARFNLVYTAAIGIAALSLLARLDPLKLTVASMALTAATLPLAVFPFIVLMNDRHYVRQHGNGWFANGVVVGVMMLALVLAVVTIPLELMGG